MYKYTFSQRLRQIQNERNLRQIDIIRLAEPYCNKFKIRIGRNDISQYISGKTEPRQNKIYILAKALNVSEAWLMGFDVPRERTEEEATDTEPLPSEIDLSDTEKKFLKMFSQLTDTGKEKVIDYTRLIFQSEKATK